MPNIALELGKQSRHFGVKSAYGEQQDVDGVSIIPVAAHVAPVSAVAGREGQRRWRRRRSSLPFGVYIRREDGLRFEPNMITLLGVAVPFVWVAGRALSRVIRALKK